MKEIWIKVGDTVDLDGERHVVKKIEYVFSDVADDEPCIIVGFRDENNVAQSIGYKIVAKGGN